MSTIDWFVCEPIAHTPILINVSGCLAVFAIFVNHWDDFTFGRRQIKQAENLVLGKSATTWLVAIR